MYDLTEADFLRALVFYWRQAGQPEVSQFITDAIAGAHQTARPAKTWQDYQEDYRRRGICITCGTGKPDGIRSRERCVECLDKAKTYVTKSNARREARR